MLSDTTECLGFFFCAPITHATRASSTSRAGAIGRPLKPGTTAMPVIAGLRVNDRNELVDLPLA